MVDVSCDCILEGCISSVTQSEVACTNAIQSDTSETSAFCSNDARMLAHRKGTSAAYGFRQPLYNPIQPFLVEGLGKLWLLTVKRNTTTHKIQKQGC